MSREINILTPENVEVKFELAGIGIRFLALLIDGLIQAAVILVLVLIVIGVVSATRFSMNGLPDWVATTIIGIVIFIFFVITYGYFLLYEATKNGQTPGKKAMKIRVIRDTGHPVDFRSALIRNLLRVVDQLPSAYLVGFITMFISPQYRRVGDYVAGTLVVKSSIPAIVSNNESASTATTVQSDSNITNVIPQSSMIYFGKISKEDYRVVRHFIDRMNQLEPHVANSYATKIAEPIAEKLEMDKELIEDPIVLLATVCREWERRMVFK